MRRKFLLSVVVFSLLFIAMGTSVLRAQELYVSCDYNSNTEGWGTTRFSNYAGAYAYATANSKTNATIVVEKTNTIGGNCFDNNHKNYSNLKVVIKDGAAMGNAASKWDMTYPVTVEPGGTLTCARPKTASVSYIHIKNTLTVGAEGAEKKAYVDFLSDTYQDCDISIRYNGKINVYNSVFKVQDLDAQGTLTIADSEVTVDGAFASATFFATTLTNTTMTVNGNQISGGISDFAGGDSNQLGKVTLNNSTITINEGTTKVAATVTANGSEINVNDLTINSGKKVNLNGGSVLDVETLNIVGTGSVVPDETSTIENNGQIIVAMIGQNVYTSLADALSAASAMTGDVTVEIYEKVTLNQPLAGSYSSIKFLAKDTDAEIYLDVEGYITATGKEVAFEGLTLSKSQGGYITNAGFMNVAFGVYDVTKVTYTNCTFANGAYASSGNVTYTGCTFKRSHDKYGLWAYGNVDVTVNGCTFADYRGIKMYAEGAAKTVDLTVKNTNFSAVTDKPAIVLTYGEKVTLEGNTYSETGTFELDLDGAPNGTTVTSDVDPICKNDNGACGVLCDGKIYTTVAQAAEVATPGSTVTLLHNSTETVVLPVGVILDKNGYEAAGITVTQPVAQVGETPYYDLQDAIVAAAPSGTVEILSDVTVDEWIMFSETLNIGSGQIITMNINGLTINGNGKTVTINSIESASNGNRLFYDATKLNINNWTINYANGVAGGIGLTSGNISNVTFIGGTYGVFPGAGNVTVTGCTFNTNGTAIYFEQERDYLVVTNNTFELPADANVILLRGDVKFTGNIVVSGRTVNVVSGSPEVTGNDFNEVRFKVYNAATATIEDNEINVLAFNDNSVVLSTFGENTLSTEAQAVLDGASFPVAQIGETKYGTLQAALQAAAQTEELTTIQLLAGTHTFGNVKFPATLKNVTIVGADNKATIIKDSKLYSADGNAVTYKGITFDGIVFDNSSILFTGARNGEVVYEDWTIKNCDFRNLQSSDGIAAIHFNLAADETIKNFTFEKNTITDVTSPSNSASGLRLNYVTGNVVIKDNETNNVAFNAVQIINSVVDNFTFEGNILRSNSSSLANLYNVTGENIVITKNQFLANENQKSVSNIAYADVSGNYWGGGAPKNLPEGVVYSSYYTTVESDGTLGGLVELPQGNQPIAYVKEVDGYVRVWGETWGNAKESYALELYSGETKIATTELNNVGGIINGSVNVTWNFFYPESTDEYWTTTWHENPQADKQPDKVVLVIDGVAVNEGPVYMSGADGINPVVWADLGGVISGGTWGGIDWTLVDGTLTITPTTGTPTTDNSGKWSYEVGQWPEAVIYDNNGVGVDIGLWPYDRTKVKTLVIEEGVTSIGSFTAQGFTNLTGEVEIPYTVKYIGQEAFQRSTMTTLTFAPVPEGKTGEELCIAQGALKNLVIEEITFPEDRPVHLHAWMFANSNNLKHVTFPATVVGIGGTVHVDYSHNPNATHGGGSNSCGLLSKCPALETITFGSQEVRDMYYNPYYEREDAPIVVNVGLKSYKDFRAGINAAQDGETVLLLGNVTLEDTWTIPAGMNLTLDLNGKTISQEKECTASYEMINNKGNLTIKGNGKISFNDTGVGDPNFGWGSYTVRNEGTLVVENGTIEHLGEQNRPDNVVHMYCAIFQYNGSSTINDGTISTPTYRSARLWKGDMTINGGTFDGQLWVQCVDNSAELTINGGKFSPNGGDGSSVFVGNPNNTAEFTVTGGTFETKIGCNDAENLTGGLISGGNFTAAAVANTSEALLAPGFVFSDEANAEGYYTVEDDPKTEYISTIEGLKAFRDAVNAGNTYQGVTVYLTEDIDLAEGQTRGAEESNWTPIGNSTNKFQGTFDGQNHTISNLVINGGSSSNQGFFGMTTDGEIKNVIFENAKVSGRLNVGVVAGTPYTSKYTNIKVKGHVEVNGMAYVGGVGGKNAYANWTDITVDVDETSYVKANSVENGTAYRTYVGGVVGFNGEGGHTFKNITSNIKVIGSTCDIGGIFGIAHYGNNFENIEHSGSVINETNDATEALETGLIAGVWHNAKGTSVTFTNAASSGTISAPYAGVTFPENSLVGAAYTPSNETSGTSGSLVINGETVYPYVAKIGDAGYNTLAKAVTAAQDGETIQLLWAQDDDPIAMNASLYGKDVTITGAATVDWSKGNLFVGRGGEGNAKLTFESANLTSASNSSSYGIHVSGREKNTNNKYDGTLVINNSTIDLDYLINRGTIELDGGNLTVKNGFGIAGRPGTETESGEDATATITLNNESKVVVNNHNGMGLGIAATQLEGFGIMNINSGSTFETTQSFTVTAKGTMNVNGGNVKVVGTLTNNGEDAINVNEGESTLNITTLTGKSINLNEGAIVKNSTVGGAAYVAGNVLFRGDNTFAMITDYGDYYSSTTPSMWTVEAGASLTLTKTDRYGLGYGDKVTVYGEIEDEKALTARASLTDEDASVNMYGGLVGMTNSASPDANNVFKAEDAYLIFGVNGDKSFGNKSGDYYGNYDIDFTNCVVTANGFKFYEDKGNSDVYFNKSDLLVNGVLMTNDASSKFTFENSVVLSMATSNGTDDKNQNAGELTLVNTTMTYSAPFTNVGNLNIGESSTFTASSVVNNGTINFTALSAKLDTDTKGLTIVDQVNNPDYKVVYKEGAYQFVQKVYVAQIGENKYESLQEAVEAVAEDETIVLLGDITFTTGANGSTNGISYTRGVNFTLDLSGKTITSDLGGNALRFKIGDGNDITNTEVTINVKNGKVVSGSNNWCAISAAVAENSNNKLTMNLTNLVVEANKAGDFAIKSWAGAVVNTNNVDVISSYAGGFYACGGEIVLDENSSVNQEGLHTQPYMSYAFGVSSNGKMTINGGTYSAVPAAATDAYNQGTSHGSAVGGVMNSGGTLIINGGTFSNDNFGDNSLATAARYLIYADAKGDLQINGGTFNALEGIIDNTTNTGADVATVTLKGGTYSANPKPRYNADAAIPEGYSVTQLPNGYYTVIQTAGTQTRDLVAGWSWFSTYVDIELADLQTKLGNNGVQIKGQEGYTQYYSGLNAWSPGLSSISPVKMYMIKTNDAQSISLEGDFVAEDRPITLNPGWNWIGYPVRESVALLDAIENITPSAGDVIKSHLITAYYQWEQWIIEINSYGDFIMTPGEGYMYYSNSDESYTFTYSKGTGTPSKTASEPIEKHWIADATQYANNMTMIAMLSIDGEIVKGDYEIAAFANGECRGSARPIYIEAIDSYVLIMTINGEEVEELSFKYYDVNNGSEYELSNRVNYSNDAILGTAEEPYMLTLDITGVDEASMSEINIYPNPTTIGSAINLQATCDKVEVFNALGVKIAEYQNVDSIDALETAGIYVIRVTDNNEVKHCRLVVK